MGRYCLGFEQGRLFFVTVVPIEFIGIGVATLLFGSIEEFVVVEAVRMYRIGIESDLFVHTCTNKMSSVVRGIDDC